MIAKQASAWHFWVFLSTNFLFRRLAKEGRKIGELERKMLEDYSTPHGKRYFVNLSWVIPCCEQKLGIGAQAMCIACNDISAVMINFRKSKTHAITDTSCILHKTLNSCWPKTYGKKHMEKYEKSWDGLPSSPKSKRGQKPFGILP